MNRLPVQASKVCCECKVEKPASEFSNGSRKYRRLTSRCKSCAAEKTREYNRKHREKDPIWHKEQEWRRHIKRAFGLSNDDYCEMLRRQGGVCAICGELPPELRLSVDHCHETGKVRGLLCRLCNAALGAFRDSPELLEYAIIYLIRTDRKRDLPDDPGGTCT